MLTVPRRPYSVPIRATESLPFLVRFVDSPQDLRNAVEIRSSAFMRHVPGLGAALRDPESDDHRADVLLLIAERKADRRVLGSMRLQPNINRPLRLEGELSLPESYRNRRLVEFMRLGIENGDAGSMVRPALAKAGYEICHAASFDFIFAAGRHSTSQIYRSMLFDDVFPNATVALSYADNMEHSIFALPIQDADRRWRESGHGLYDFMATTAHPDIRIDYERVFRVFAA